MDLPKAYTLNNVIAALNNPGLFFRHLQYISVRINGRLQKPIRGDRMDVMAEDWTNLVILDACRYDMFEDELKDNSWMDYEVEKRRSPASESREFMRASWVGKELHDTIYVTANPHAEATIPDGTFHDVMPLYSEEWDDEHETVHPAIVAREGMLAREKYPNKRLIIHFMQPHFPFLGEEGPEFKEGWDALRYGKTDMTIDEVWAGYRGNLKYVLNYVEELVEEFTSTTIITSDHGNLVGEITWPIPAYGFGHKPGVHVPETITVPLLTIPGNDRKITSDPPVAERDTDDEVESRLKALGYR